jgi:WD40 repeat protein
LIDVPSGKEVASVPLTPEGETEGVYDWGLNRMAFLPDGHVLGSGPGGLRRFDLASGRIEWLWRTNRKTSVDFAVSADGARLVAVGSPGDDVGGAWEAPVRVDVATGTRTALTAYGRHVQSLAVDASGTVLATGDDLGVVRVGRSAGGEPHLLLGHGGPVTALAFSPDRRWIASASGGEIRLWPMPDLSKPPLHALPYAELMVRLRALTNLQVVEDPSSPGGWKLAPIASTMSSKQALESRGIDCLAKNGRSQAGLDRVGENEVDPAAEQLLQEQLQIHVPVERLLVELDDEVEIAGRACLVARNGAEEAEPPGPKLPEWGTVLFERS